MTKIYYLNRLFPKNNFRNEDEKIIESIIEAIKNKSVIDIRTIAQMNYTSQSSISRLAKRAGFNNFKELIFFLSIVIYDKYNQLIFGKILHQISIFFYLKKHP